MKTSVNPARTLPLSVNASVDTMKEHLAIKATPLAADSRDKLVAIHRSDDDSERHQTELLGVRQQPHPQLPGEIQTLLVHFYEDSGSASGWVQCETPLPDMYDPASQEKVLSGVRALSGFYQNGITYLFVQYQSPLAEHSRSVKIMWSVMEHGQPVWREKKWSHQGDDARSVLASVRQLSVHRRADGQHVVYGISRGFGDPERGLGNEEFFMLVAKQPADADNITVHDIAFDTLHDDDNEIPGWQGIETAGVYQLATPLEGEGELQQSRYTLFRMRNGEIDIHTTRVTAPSRFYANGLLEFETNSVRVNTAAIDLSGARVLTVAAGLTDAVLIHQPDGDLGVLEGVHSSTPQYRSLLGSDAPSRIDRLSMGVSGKAAAADAGLLIYATESGSNRLWLCRMQQQQTQWVCLGDQVSDMVCPRINPYGAEVFLLASQSGAVQFKRQHPLTHSWSTDELAVATTELETVEPVNAHVLDIEVLDANLIPCAAETVLLHSDAPCLLYIDGVSYRSGPRLPLELHTNAYGRIRAVIPANGLKTPRFSARVQDVKALNIQPNGRISERLAGNAKGFNVSQSIAELAPAEHRSSVARLVKSYGDAASKAKRGVECDGQVRKQYRLSVAGKGQFEEETPDTAGLKTLAAGSLPGFAGDILNAIRTGVQQIAELVVRVLDASVEFLIKIGDEVYRFANTMFDSIVDGFEALAEFLARVFNKIGEVVDNIAEKILDAVSFVFGGNDVFAANDAIQATVKGGFLATARSAAKLGRSINREYQQQIDKLDTELERLIGQAEKASGVRGKSAEQGISFGGIHLPAPSATVKENRAGSDVMAGNQSKLDEQPGQNDLPQTEAQVLDNLLNRLQSNFNNDVAAVVQDIGEILTSDSSLLDKLTAMPFEILRLLKGVIKTIAKLAGDVLQAALELVNILVGRLFEALESKIHIPFLNTLVQLWSGDNNRQLSFFDIVTLPFAFVGTAIWKIVSGKALVTQESCEDYMPWAENLGNNMKLESVINNSAQVNEPVLHKSVGAAAVGGNNGISVNEINGFLKIMLCLTVITAIAGILFGLTAQPLATADEITLGKSGPAGIVMTVMAVISVVMLLISELTTLFYEAIEGVHLPTGVAMTSDEKEWARQKIHWVFLAAMFAIVAMVVGVIAKVELEVSVMNTIQNVLSALISLVLLIKAIITLVGHANDIDKDSDNEEPLWGIGLESASAIAYLLKCGASITVIVATRLFRAEPVSGAVAGAVAVGCQVAGTLLSEGGTIVASGRQLEVFAV